MSAYIDIDRIINRPPEYPIDAVAEWVAPMATEWDDERADRERKLLYDEAIASLPEDATADQKTVAIGAAAARHPVAVWLTGSTGYSWDAPLTVPEILRTEAHPSATATIRDYLTGTPIRFVIRSLDPEPYREAELAKPSRRAITRVRHGLVALKVGSKTVEPDRDDDGAISEAWIGLLDRSSDRTLLDYLSGAIYRLSNYRGAPAGKVGDAEGKH